MKTVLTTTLFVLAFLLTSCSEAGKPETPVEEPEIELNKCCTEALAVLATLSPCCQRGTSVCGELSGCCVHMLDDEPPEDLKACCKASREKLEEISECCWETLRTGEEGPCCEGMVAAVAAQAAAHQ